MDSPLFRIRWIPILALTFAGLGCTAEPFVDQGTVSGTFEGVTLEAHPISLSLEQDGQAFSGHGTLGGQPVVIAGPVTFSALASLTHADGSFSTVHVTLSPDGESLSLQREGEAPTVLARSGPSGAATPGPFSGNYKAQGAEAPLARAVITQNGSLIAGIGIVLGEAVGIGGRVTASNEAKGILTFADESHAGFTAKLSADGQSVSVTGVGRPVVLARQ